MLGPLPLCSFIPMPLQLVGDFWEAERGLEPFAAFGADAIDVQLSAFDALFCGPRGIPAASTPRAFRGNYQLNFEKLLVAVRRRNPELPDF